MSDPEQQASAPAPIRRFHRTRRVLKFTCLGTLAVGLIARLTLSLWLPEVVEGFAARAGLHVSYTDLNLSLLGGSVELWGLEIEHANPAAGESEHLVDLDYLAFDLETSALLGGATVIRRAELGKGNVYLRRRAEGTWQFADLVSGEGALEAPPSDASSLEKDALPEVARAVDLRLPVAIERMAVSSLRVHLQDELKSESRRLDFSFSLTDFGGEPSAEVASQLHAEVSIPGILTALRVDGRIGQDLLKDADGVATGEVALETALSLDLFGLDPNALEPWSEELGVRGVADDIEAHFGLTARLFPGNSPGDLGLKFGVGNAFWQVDGQAVAVMEEVSGLVRLGASTYSMAGSVGIEPVVVRGLRAEATLLESGELGVLGFAMVSKPASPATGASDPPPVSPPSAAKDSLAIQFAGLAMSDCGVRFTDDRAGTDLLFEMDRLDLGSFQIGGTGNLPSPFSMQVRAPGIFSSATVEGVIGLGVAGLKGAASGARNSAALGIKVQGIHPRAIEPYLAAAGVDSLLESAEFDGHLNIWATSDESGLGVQLDVTELVLADGSGEKGRLASLAAAGVHGLHIARETGAIEIESIFLIEPTVDVIRTLDGAIEVAGLRFGGAAQRVEDVDLSAETPTSNAGDEAGDLQFKLGRFGLQGTHFSFRNAQQPGSIAWRPERLDLELTGVEIVIGAPQGQVAARLGAAKRAQLHVAIELPGTLDSLDLKGEVEIAENGIATNLTLDAKGVSLERFRSYLADLGVVGELSAGQLHGELDARLELDADVGQIASLQLSDWRLFDGQENELFGLDQLRVPRVVLPSEELAPIQLAGIEITGVRLVAKRNRDGGTSLFGLRMGGPLNRMAPVDLAASVEPVTGPSIPGPALRMESGGVRVQDVVVSWRDEAVQPVVESQLRLSAQISPFQTLGTLTGGAKPRPLTLKVDAVAQGLVDQLGVELEVTADPAAPNGRGTIRLSGIRGDGLASYMPEGVACTLSDGSLGLPFSFGVVSSETTALDAELGPLVLAEGGVELARIERFALHASQLSPEGISLEEAAVTGIQLDVSKREDGTMVVPGFLLAAAKEPHAELPASGQDQAVNTQVVPGSIPYFVDLPKVHVGVVEIAVEHLGFQDFSTPGAAPLDLQFSLRNRSSWTRDLEEEARGPEDALYPALELELAGHALPVAAEISAWIDIKPFAVDPELKLAWVLGGLSGQGLLELVPALQEAIDGQELVGGEFSGRLDSVLSVRRRGPLDLDFSAGFGGQLELQDVAFRAVKDGRVLLGFDTLVADLANMSLRTGQIHLNSLELVHPVGFVTRDAEGAHLLGLTLKNTEDAVAEDASASLASKDGEMGASAPIPESPSTSPKAELRVDRIFISGADLEFRDETVTPPMVLPLDDLDVVISGFNSRALTEPLPLRLELFAQAAPISLRARHEEDNLLLGVMGAAVDLLSLAGGDFEMEPRRAFSALEATAKVTLFPAPKGWLQLEVAGVELPNYRGLALASGVDIGDGVVDLGVDVRFLGERGASVDTQVTASYLSLSEPPGGPISTYLKLPAPLDTVLFLLRNENGDQEVKLHFNVGEEGAEGLSSAIATTLGLIIGEAIASSPMRLIGGVLDITGLFDSEPIELPDEVYGVTFLAGATESLQSADLLGELAPVLKLLREDALIKIDLQHAFGRADLVRLDLLANPDPAACVELSRALRSERDQIRNERDEVAAQLRTAYALGDLVAVEGGRWTLTNLDADLGRIEDTIDAVLEFLRPGAERRSERRMKVAALLIAQQRLEAVRAALRALPIPSIGTRVRLRRPRFSEPEFDGGGRVFAIPAR
mgnify:FL=1